jgi:hypothetical protein
MEKNKKKDTYNKFLTKKKYLHLNKKSKLAELNQYIYKEVE